MLNRLRQAIARITNTTPVPPVEGGNPASQAASNTTLQGQLSHNILIGAVSLGLLAFLANLPGLLASGDWNSIIIFVGLLLASLAIILLFPRLQARRPALAPVLQTVRAGVIVFAAYMIAVTILITDGMGGAGRMFLVAVPLLIASLVHVRYAYAGIAFSLLTLLGIGLLMSIGLLSAPVPLAATENQSFIGWLQASLNFLLLVVIVTLPLTYLLRSLQSSLATQTSLATNLQAERQTLEERVATRTQDIQRRLLQIRTAAEISRSLGALLEPAQLLDQVVNRIRNGFDLYYVGVFLLDTEIDLLAGTQQTSARSESARNLAQAAAGYAVLVAGTGQAGEQMLAAGHKLSIGGASMIGDSISTRQARIALDVGDTGVRFNNPLLPETRSEIALPILVRRQFAGQASAQQALDEIAIGAISLQSNQPAAFDEGDIAVLGGIADSLGIALENARLFSEVRLNLVEIEGLHRQYLASAWTEVRQATQSDLSYTYLPAGPSATATTPASPQDLQQTGLPSAGTRQLNIPIALRDQTIGSLALELPAIGSAQNDLSDEERILIDGVIAQAALALENARLIGETEQRVVIERLRGSLSGKIWSAGDIQAILRTTLQELAIALGARSGTISLRSTEAGSLADSQMATLRQTDFRRPSGPGAPQG